MNAGEARLEVKPDLKKIAGAEHYEVEITGKSYPIFDGLYKVRDYYQSFINTKTLLPSVFIRNVTEGRYKKTENYVFDQLGNRMLINKKVIKLTSTMHDLVSAFYYIRCIDYSKKPIGTVVKLKTCLDGEFFDLELSYDSKKTIKTALGSFRCYVFKPKLLTGRIFKGQNDMTIYVSEDKNQIPIRVESAVYLGSVRADLISFQGLKFPFSSMISK